MRAITPDRPSIADITTLIDECSGQVSRDVEEGASGPEAFTLLLRGLMTHVDHVDTGDGYTLLYILGDVFLQFHSGVSRASVGSNGERVHSGSWGGRGVGSGPDGGQRAVSHLDAYLVPWFDGYGPEAVRFVGQDVESLQRSSS